MRCTMFVVYELYGGEIKPKILVNSVLFLVTNHYEGKGARDLFNFQGFTAPAENTGLQMRCENIDTSHCSERVCELILDCDSENDDNIWLSFVCKGGMGGCPIPEGQGRRSYVSLGFNIDI